MQTNLVRRYAIPLGLSLACLPFPALANRAQAQRIADVTVIGLDYAFQAPDTVAGGLTAVSFENRGKVRHEVVIVRLRAGVTVDSVLHGDPAARRTLTELVGILIAEPGERSLGRLLVDFSPKRTYMLLCNFQDAPDKPRHLAMGMLGRLEVK